MQDAPPRRFNIGDAMIMIAAVTPSLILVRTGVKFGLFKIGGLTESGRQRVTLARQLMGLFSVGGGCLLASLVPAVLILGLYRAHPSRREATQGPGLVACLVAVAASITPIIYFVGTFMVESRSPEPHYSVPFGNAFGRWNLIAGPMVLGAWMGMALLGRWRPRPTWTDRAGCVLGACIVLIYLHSHVYFEVVEPITYWWNG